MLCINPEQQNKSFAKELGVKHASRDMILTAARKSLQSDAERCVQDRIVYLEANLY